MFIDPREDSLDFSIKLENKIHRSSDSKTLRIFDTQVIKWIPNDFIGDHWNF